MASRNRVNTLNVSNPPMESWEELSGLPLPSNARLRANSVNVNRLRRQGTPSSGSSSELRTESRQSSSGNDVRTASRRSRANTVNIVVPEHFEVGMEVSSPDTIKKKLKRLFKPIDPWAGDAKEVLARFDEKLVAISVQEGEKLLAEGVTLVDESYKDKPVFLEAIENKERFISQLIKAAKLETLTDAEGRNLYNETLLNMIKRYLEPIIRIFIDRRNPEYLVLLAGSPCTAQLIASPEITGRLLRFQSMLESAISEKEPLMFASALEFGMGAAVQVALILANGSDVINHESFVWSTEGMELKAILEHQEIPLGVKDHPENMYKKRYSECVNFFGNEAVRAVLANSGSSLYNRMIRLNKGLAVRNRAVDGGRRRKTRKTKAKGRLSRRSPF